MRNTLLILLLSLLLCSCIVVETFRACESMREGELRFALPSRSAPAKAKFHLPTFCQKFYGDGTGRWIECMGVGLK